MWFPFRADTDTIVLGVTYNVACHKVHISQLLGEVKLQRQKIPRVILEPLAFKQEDGCFYLWVLCGSRRYTQDERRQLETCTCGPR